MKKLIEELANEGRTVTYTTKILADMTRTLKMKMVGMYSIGDGTTALLRYEDGNAYEVIVRPVKYGEFKNLWGDKIKKREERTPKKEDDDESLM